MPVLNDARNADEKAVERTVCIIWDNIDRIPINFPLVISPRRFWAYNAISGPPETGKTAIGLEIIRRLEELGFTSSESTCD
jgi:hypothetical protein